MRQFAIFPVILIAGVSPASADSRDLVLDRMSRCYSITETRQYLECLYGAVQPLRNELGLPLAPQASTFSALFARPAAPSPYAPSAAPVAAPAPAMAIRQEPDPGAVSSTFSAIMGIETRRVAPEQFGLRNARPGTGVNVDRITARLADYSFSRGTRKFTITLDNGQVWRQGAGDSASWNKPAGSYLVTISYGANGTFNLTEADERRLYKVERIR